MTKTIRGRVHGRTIELDEDVGAPDGQEVEVQVKIVPPTRKWGEGILRTAGALADDPEWDAIMEDIHQARKVERRSQGEELNDPSTGHEHLLSPHAASLWAGAPFFPICGWHCHPHGRLGGR